ncbi:unnamed protein product [Soboliphyme baturini]|uniref:Secreted protein n=1 Tax=Soboliphyme baturini TaxID=241478 RepID=A0A183IKL8_9BILA|nr:unnamed protein product [Soboliphyme baturini]
MEAVAAVASQLFVVGWCVRVCLACWVPSIVAAASRTNPVRQPGPCVGSAMPSKRSVSDDDRLLRYGWLNLVVWSADYCSLTELTFDPRPTMGGRCSSVAATTSSRRQSHDDVDDEASSSATPPVAQRLLQVRRLLQIVVMTLPYVFLGPSVRL